MLTKSTRDVFYSCGLKSLMATQAAAMGGNCQLTSHHLRFFVFVFNQFILREHQRKPEESPEENMTDCII